MIEVTLDGLLRTIAARDRRIERLVAALDDARSQGYTTGAEKGPQVVLSDTRAAPSAPRVRALVWEDAKAQGCWVFCHTDVGDYRCGMNTITGLAMWTKDLCGGQSGLDGLDAAKAAAQSDFTARILAAIDMGETE